jgi:hypothetical protein
LSTFAINAKGPIDMALALWICGFGHTNTRNFRNCETCSSPRKEKHAQVHQRERSVVYYNPATGEHRTPPRADQPVPEIYARQGFQRREILHMGQYERETGVIHEASTFRAGNEPSPWKEPEPPPMPADVRENLINDVREAIASGPWTDDGRDDHKFTVAAPI